VTWANRRFATARSLRLQVERDGYDWEAFLASHPSVVSTYGLKPVMWDGRQYFSRSGISGATSRSGVAYGVWANRHPRAAATLKHNRLATAAVKPTG
jgi:hypothetical protein